MGAQLKWKLSYSMVLLDNLDLHLHPKWMRAVMPLVKQCLVITCIEF